MPTFQPGDRVTFLHYGEPRAGVVRHKHRRDSAIVFVQDGDRVRWMHSESLTLETPPKDPEPMKDNPLTSEPLTVDLTPTWSGILPYILTVLRDGNGSGQKIALEELERMAKLADRYVASQKTQPAGGAQ
jgi:hypothetical protein